MAISSEIPKEERRLIQRVVGEWAKRNNLSFFGAAVEVNEECGLYVNASAQALVFALIHGIDIEDIVSTIREREETRKAPELNGKIEKPIP